MNVLWRILLIIMLSIAMIDAFESNSSQWVKDDARQRIAHKIGIAQKPSSQQLRMPAAIPDIYQYVFGVKPNALPYEILGLKPNATPEEINARRREISNTLQNDVSISQLLALLDWAGNMSKGITTKRPTIHGSSWLEHFNKQSPDQILRITGAPDAPNITDMVSKAKMAFGEKNKRNQAVDIANWAADMMVAEQKVLHINAKLWSAGKQWLQGLKEPPLYIKEQNAPVQNLPEFK